MLNTYFHPNGGELMNNVHGGRLSYHLYVWSGLVVLFVKWKELIYQTLSGNWTVRSKPLMQVSLSANHQASTRFSCFFEFARCFLWRFRGTDSYFAIYMSFVGCICLLQNCPHRCGDNHGVVVRKRSLGVASFIWHLQCLSWKYELLVWKFTRTLFWNNHD